jgi:hypothetical protein
VLSVATVVGLGLLAQTLGSGPLAPAVPPPPPGTPVLPPPGDLPRHPGPPAGYAADGTSNLAAAIAPNWADGGPWGTSVGYRRFVADGVGPGVAASYYSFGALEQVWLGASLRLVPLRAGRVGVAVTPEAARVFVWGYSDGWALGGNAALILTFTRRFSAEAGAEVFFFPPASFGHAFTPHGRLVRPLLALDVAL